MGRFTIAKSLIVSKLSHLLILLPNPCQKTISKLTKLLFVFIWGSKCYKNKRAVVTPHHTLGLNMDNLAKFTKSLKMLSDLESLREVTHGCICLYMSVDKTSINLKNMVGDLL